jgi:hypothetical protein
MARQALFSGLVVDEFDRAVDVAIVGGESFYVVDDAGFRRHISSEQVDRQILNLMRDQIKGNEEEIAEQSAKMLGTQDIFSKAMIENQLKNIDQQWASLFETGIPEEGRAYMGMIGFKITIDIHGEVIAFHQPAGADEGG